MNIPSRCLRQCAIAMGLLLVSVGMAQADDFWKKKPPSEWTRKQAQKVLKKSPWAKDMRVAYREVPVDPEIGTTVRLGRRNPAVEMEEALESKETVAWYLVRWESAGPVADAFIRLDELGETDLAASLAPPPRLSEDRYVITVATTTPPFFYPGILDRQADWDLKKNAKLIVSGLEIHPEEVVTSGTRTHPAAHFYFPRTHNGKPLLKSQGGKVEFRLKGNLFLLRAKFKLPAESVE